MLNIVLYEPEIPPNTGNIIRLCANTGAQLHLIEPLGFNVDDTKLKRAGLDYHDWEKIKIHASYQIFLQNCKPSSLFACSTKGKLNYTEASFSDDSYLLFGPETRGLPQSVLETYESKNIIKIPMAPNNRSLNLSNATAIILYEAWRQLGFAASQDH